MEAGSGKNTWVRIKTYKPTFFYISQETLLWKAHYGNAVDQRNMSLYNTKCIFCLKVNGRLQELLEEEREVDHVEFEEFLVC